METFLYICTIVLICSVPWTRTTPWIKNQCLPTADGYDCSDLALSFVPNEIPESTKSLEFSFNYLPTIYNSTFQRLKNLTFLDLTRCSTVFMYEAIFQHQPHLESLILVGNPLVFIADNTFSGLWDLKYLSLAQSKIQSLTDIPIASLSFLEILDLEGNYIHSLDGLSDFPLQHLKKLLLGMNSIEKIKAVDMQAFQETSRLHLSFKGNDLLDVEPNAFQSLDLHSLDFSGCFNKMNTSVLLKGLEGVKTNKLYLGVYEDSSSSSINSAGIQSFCKMSVVDLDLQIQHFPDLTETTFQCMTGLQRLDLTRAHLSSFPAHMSNLSTLSHLVLDENSFKDVCHINAASFPMVTHLSISGNLQFMAFKESCVEPLVHLQELDLSHSSMNTGASCCNKQLSGLSELRFLNLSYNFAMQWDSLPFIATSQLLHLDCSHLNYSLTISSPFSNLQNLQTLNLSWTATDLSNGHLLKGLRNLRVLNLKGNAIHGGVIAGADNFNYVPLLETLDLSICGITSISKNVFKGLTNLRYVDLSGNQLVSPSMPSLSSQKTIQLNLAKNTIAKVNVEDLREGMTFDLSYNPLICNCTNYQFIKWVKQNVNKMKHLHETFCASTNNKIIDVDLNCEISNRNPAIIILLTFVIIIAIIIVVFYSVGKIRARSVVYSRL